MATGRRFGTVVVGASLGGVRVVQALRAAGYAESIALVGDELHPPYDRPPLSKQFLLDETRDVSDLALLPVEEMSALEPELILGRTAVAFDARDRCVTLDDGTRLTGETVVIATGARARRPLRLPPSEHVLTLRTVEDARAIRDALRSASSLLVVGAGFIGCEVASAARERGVGVTVVEAMPTPMSRVLAPELGSRLAAFHAECGSDLRCSTRVMAVEGTGSLERVTLSDGTVVAADLLVAGVGSEPSVDWLRSSSLMVGDGVHCDEHGRAVGGDRVYAVGDVARWRSSRFGDAVRTEHWTAAGDQASMVAADILNLPVPGEPVPYVWSDQFGRRIQLAGRCAPTDAVHVVRDGGKIVAFTERRGRLSSVLAVDDPRSFGKYRRLLASDASWEAVMGAAGIHGV
ncbi:NAD(P)/FAD-dependent oxidoreductase [Amycolatopsis sp. ATCC 39116]|uniref:NAD(P)/FAD-dependent oxidoreductase n=1 Tax=Amycolatopsis sp. (strain ATCC 39116 / 75iv2) TaxID=385957 RepID=UPI000262651D|nr:FAD-dependent oxidoreductase [Amycolatopsis sp. ATCC 39116]